MPVITDFCKSVTAIVTWGAKANRKNRSQIRELVLKLGTELERGTSIFIVYFEGARGITDDKELAAYLRGARGKLLKTCDEYHICAALYELCDRFQQLFDLSRLSLSVGRQSEIQSLIYSLRDRERSILDSFSSALFDLEQSCRNLDMGGAKARSSVMDAIDGIISDLRYQQTEVKAVVRKVGDCL